MSRMSQRRYAARIGVSHVYIGRLIRQGKLPADEHGKVDPVKADAALAAMREPARPQRRAGPAKTSSGDAAAVVNNAIADGPPPVPFRSGGDLPTLLLKTRIKSEAERAKLLEIKAKVEAGKYVDADEVRVAAFNKGRTVRDNLLNIPGRLAAVVAAETDERKCFELIDSEIKAALKVLAGDTDGG